MLFKSARDDRPYELGPFPMEELEREPSIAILEAARPPLEPVTAPPPPVDPSKLRVVDLNAALQKRGVETKDLKLKKGLVPALDSGGDHARA